MSWSRTNWFRCLCWAVSYLLFFDTLATSTLRYVTGWPRLHFDPQVSAAQDPAEGGPSGDRRPTGAAVPRGDRAEQNLSGLPGDLAAPAAAAGRILHVSATDATCGGISPCFRTIQGAIGSALSGDRVLIHPGLYSEQLRIFDKNDKASASEVDRIVIEADPEAPFGSVVVGPPGGARCPKGASIDIKRSSFVTVRGIVFRNAGGKGVLLRGQGRGNEAIHIERNRIYADGDSRCSRGISIWHGNKDTLIANNLIDGNDREGIYVTDDRDGVHTIVSNTLYANKRGGILLARRHRAILANNLIIANGEDRSGRRGGIQRRAKTPGPEGVTLLGNLVCGNEPQEIKGVLLDRTDAGNLTPTGTEGSGVAASPGCDDLENVFAGMFGGERAAAKQTEEFRLAEGSPAIDAGVGLVEALPNVAAALLRADLLRSNAVRPTDGDDDGESDYDMGAIENGEPGEATPTPTPSPTPVPTPTASPIPPPTFTPDPTSSPSPVPTPTASPLPTAKPTPTSDPTPSPSPSPDPTASPEPVPCLSCDVCDTGLPGICSVGRTFCNGEFAEPECRTTVEPQTESCGNQIDENCDGVVDEGGVPEDLPTAPPQTGVFVEPLGTTITFLQNGGSAIGLAPGDFDQNGTLDFAVTENAGIVNGRRVSIVLGNGDGTFGPPSYLVFPENVSSNGVLAHDFDRDGPLDLLVPLAELQQVYFYRGDGNGNFAEPVPSGMGGRAGQIQSADLNCDGILDFAALIDERHVTVGFGNGDGTFAAPTSYLFNHNLVDLALTDVNGDGHPDLVTGSNEFAPITGIGVRLNDGAGQFGDLKHTPGQSVPDQFGNHGHNSVFGIQIADFDGDTVVDVVASTHGPVGCFMFMKGNGDGTFALPDLYDGLAHLDPSWTCVGGFALMRRYTDNVAPDVNADGKPDVVFTYGSDDNRVLVGISRGDGTFEPSVFAASAGTGAPGSQQFPRADGAGTASAVVADVNGDCMLDIVTAGFQTNASQGRMGVLLARAPGDFHAPRIAPLLRDPVGDNGHQTERGVTVGDFNNDGKPDFAAGVGRAFFTVPGAGIGIDIWEGAGDGRGMALPFTLNNYGGTGAAFLRTADFDQDGFLDFVFQGGDGPFGSRQSVSTVFGAGDFTFGDRQSAYSPRLDANQTNIRNLIVADFDDDDDPDVAALEDDGFGTKVITTFANPRTRAPLQFVAEVSVGSGSNGRGLVAADFDGDEELDLVAQDSGANPQRLRFFKGNGDLTFQPGVSILEWLNQGAASAEDLAAADLDEDGDQDLVWAQYFHGCAYVLLGHDDGMFDDPVCYPVWTGRTSRLAIADFDVDGSLDIVVGVEDGGLYFVRGRGDGTFENGHPIASGKHLVEVLNFADFNRDGRPDILSSFNNGNFGHSIVLSNQTGAAPTPTPGPTLPPGVTATPTAQPTASPSPSPTPTPRATATPPADLESIVVEPADQIILAGGAQVYKATGIRNDKTSLDLTGGVAWSSSVPGVATISGTGTATGVAAGQTTITAAIGSISGTATLGVGAHASDFTDPTAAITSPAANATVTAPVDVVGTATDANFLKYELEIAPVGETAFTLLKRGSAAVTNGSLGPLDPATLVNDQYVLRLTVFDRGGNQSTASVVVQIARERKIGLFTLAFRDAEVTVSGIPITIDRRYDSRDKRVGDFGVGWRLEVQTLRLRTNRVLGTGWLRSQSGAVVNLNPTDAHKVSLTLANGHVEEFDLQLSPTSGIGSLDSTSVTGFAPRPGTIGRLEALDDPDLLIVAGSEEDELTYFNGSTYDPQLFRYTAADGTKIEIHRSEGVKKITDRNGNSLSFGAGGITHSTGKSISLTRDGLGRIAQLTDPEGHTRLYGYDANGDLISSTDQVGKVTQYTYDRKHGLLDVIDPAGNRGVRNEYDESGRLTASIDAEGNRIEITHSLGTSQEIVKDRLGHTTVFEYDGVGNVVAKTNALGKLTTYSHDSRGNLLTETDPLGRVATRTYDLQNNVLTDTDFDGNTTTRTYNTRQQVLTEEDPEGHTTTNVYDANGNLEKVTDPEGGVTMYTYDPAGNQLTVTDQLGKTTTFGYDGFGNQTSITDALTHVATATYDGNGRRLTETRTRTLPGGGTQTLTTQFVYDDAGRLTKTIDPSGKMEVTTYTAVGKRETSTDKNGKTTSYEYDDRGNLAKTTFPDGSMEIVTYDPEGRELTRTNRDGFTTGFVYDALGRRSEVENPDGTSTTTTYDDVGRVLTQTDERNHTTTYAYAPNKRTTTDPLGNDVVEHFDSKGRRTKLIDGLGHVIELEYDGASRLTKTKFPDTTTKTTTYDLAGRRKTETDQAGRTTQFEYDAVGHLTKTIDANGEMTTATYDEVGNQITQTDAEGRLTMLEYDALGRLTKRIRPLGQEETFGYDGNGNRTAHVDSNGVTTTFVYDADNRLEQKNLPGESVPYDYSPAGLRTQAGDDTFTYDERGRLLTETKANGEVLTYTYDDAGNRASLTTSEGTATYTHDELNRLSTVVDSTGTTTYGYDDAGNLTSVEHPNGVIVTYGYDTLNRLTDVTNENAGGLVSAYVYTLGAAGNREQVVESGPATTGRKVTYAYDFVYRLEQEQIDEPGTANDETIDYSYDGVGNRLEMVRNGVTTTYSYDDNDRLLSETTGGTTTTYDYDDNGNMTERAVGGTTDSYDYDAENRLVQATLEGGPTGAVSYTYDTDGIRTSATRNGVTTTFVTDENRDFAQVVLERTGADSVLYTYGRELVSQVRSSGDASVPLHDGQRSTRQLADDTGSVTDSYTYDAFGSKLASTGTTPNDYLYAGEQLDPDLEAYYLRARYYDPATGRFTATDPIDGTLADPLSLHRYLYAAGDPINKSDPSGAFVMIVIPIIIGLIGFIDYLRAPERKPPSGSGRTNAFRIKVCSGGGAGLAYTAGQRLAVIAEDLEESQHPKAAKFSLSLHGVEVGGFGGGYGESDTLRFKAAGKRNMEDFVGTGSLHSFGANAFVAGINFTTMTLPDGSTVTTEFGPGFGVSVGRAGAGAQALQVDWSVVDDEPSRVLSGGKLFCN